MNCPQAAGILPGLPLCIPMQGHVSKTTKCISYASEVANFNWEYIFWQLVFFCKVIGCEVSPKSMNADLANSYKFVGNTL